MKTMAQFISDIMAKGQEVEIKLTISFARDFHFDNQNLNLYLKNNRCNVVVEVEGDLPTLFGRFFHEDTPEGEWVHFDFDLTQTPFKSEGVIWGKYSFRKNNLILTFEEVKRK